MLSYKNFTKIVLTHIHSHIQLSATVLLIIPLLITFNFSVPTLAAVSTKYVLQYQDKARTTKEFMDSLCFATHFGYLTGKYNDNFDFLVSKLKQLGVKYIRDGVPGPSEERVTKLRNAGIKMIGVSDLFQSNNGQIDQIIAFQQKVKEINKNGQFIEYVEGPNEPDYFWIANGSTYRGYGYSTGGQKGLEDALFLYTQDLYRVMKSDPATANIKIIGTAFGRPYPTKLFWDNALTDYVDYGGFHLYVGNNRYAPFVNYGGLWRYYHQGTSPSNLIDEYPIKFDVHQPSVGGKKMVATEAGYPTNLLTGGVTERVHGKYIPRMFFENFRKGIPITCSYELIDSKLDLNEREANFGILRNNGSPKPAFSSLNNLTAILKEDVDFPTTSLKYDLTVNMPAGYTKPELIHRQLLQKQNGTYFIALWHDISNTDSFTMPQTELQHPDIESSIKLTFRPRDVIVHTVLDDGSSYQFHPVISTDNQFNFLVKDKVRLIEIIP